MAISNARRPSHNLQRTSSRPTPARELRVKSNSSRALGAFATGALAVGGFALGAIAVGAPAIGRLAVGRARIGRLEIDELSVRRLVVTEELHTPQSVASERSTQPVPEQASPLGSPPE